LQLASVPSSAPSSGFQAPRYRRLGERVQHELAFDVSILAGSALTERCRRDFEMPEVLALR
jgi:hypothetical protein